MKTRHIFVSLVIILSIVGCSKPADDETAVSEESVVEEESDVSVSVEIEGQRFGFCLNRVESDGGYREQRALSLHLCR